MTREDVCQELKSRVTVCDKCALCRERHRAVFGQGSLDAKVVLLGEAPGADEDEAGLAFVGRSGQLLTQILEAAKIKRDEIFIGNVVKCRPPENRTPLQAEVLMCNDFLEAQLLLIRPRIVVCLGNTPMRWLLKTLKGITAMRGRFFPWRGIEIFPMFHPSFLLRNQSRAAGSPKELTWRDIQLLKRHMDELGLVRRCD